MEFSGGCRVATMDSAPGTEAERVRAGFSVALGNAV
jgi:hypothetical protein